MKVRNIGRKFPAVLVILCIVISLMPLSAFAKNSTVSNETELITALKDTNCTEINLGGNIETGEELDVERTVILDLNGYTLSCNSTDDDIFRVRSNGNLTVKDSSTGGKIDGQNKYCGFEVKGGTLTLESGNIVNCTDEDGDGGAVDVSNTGVTETPIKYGRFIMNGGAITGCKSGDDGAAVDIGNGCTFTLNGGTISGCRAEDDGGAVFIKQSGFFELNGGVIENCSSGNNGGAVNIYENGSFTMTGGVIKDCKVDLGGLGNAVYGRNNAAIVAISGGTIENCGVFPWSFDEFTVTFDSDGGSAVAEQKLLNSPAVMPINPKKSGYDFAGWYLGDTQYAFDTNVSENITLKAKWTPISTSTVITTATIENVKFNYQPGDAPQATALVSEADTDKYKIAYECWQQFENNEPIAAWYSDNGSHGSLPTITAFESGKNYVYSLMLTPKGSYSFSSETVITVNGKKVSAPFVGGSMYIPSIKTITIPTVTVIDVVEINDVTVNFKDGDKPVFTGKVPDGANYAYRCEWWELDSKTGAMSTDFGNFYENKITAFEAGKTYHYGVYITTIYGDRYVFGPDTKLKINGEFVNYKRYEGDTSDGSDGTMWVITDLTMTPQASGTSPDYKITEGANGSWTRNSDGTLKFVANGDFSKFVGVKIDGTLIDPDNYTAVSGSTEIALKKEFLDTLSVGKHTLTVVYSDGECSTEFKIKAAGNASDNSNTDNNSHSTKPSENSKSNSTKPSEHSKSNTTETTSPKTGYATNMLLLFGILFFSGNAIIGIMIIQRKKKRSK